MRIYWKPPTLYFPGVAVVVVVPDEDADADDAAS